MRELRTYIAAAGSGGALVAAIVVAFAALTGLVAIDGLPGGSDAAGGGSVVVQASGARQRTAGPTPAPAPRPSSPATNRARPGTDAGSPPPPGDDAPASGGSQQPANPDQPGPTDPVTPPGGGEPTSPPPAEPTPPAPDPPLPAPPPAGGDSPVGGLVDGVDDTVAAATGIDPGLGPATEAVTAPVDGTIEHVVNGAGVAPVVAGLPALGG